MLSARCCDLALVADRDRKAAAINETDGHPTITQTLCAYCVGSVNNVGPYNEEQNKSIITYIW